MSNTCAVSCQVNDQQNQPVKGAVVSATLSAVDVYQGYVAPTSVEAITNELGQAVLNLWPNQLGAVATFYRIRITTPSGRVLRTNAVVPDAPTAQLHLISEVPPFEGKTQARVVMDEVVGVAALVEQKTATAIETLNSSIASAQATAVALVTATDAAGQPIDPATVQQIIQNMRGPIGPKGDRGNAGSIGPKGEKGDKGERGEPGISGGGAGTIGPIGPKGEKGDRGDAGPQGEAGERGEAGPQGYQGVAGAEGPQGERGAEGVMGPRGLQGVPGLNGTTGPRGEPGPMGLRGEMGPQGPQGVQGETGAKGDKGDKGDRGDVGLQGIQGLRGLTGATGEQGPQGAVGPKGDKGDTGIQGAQGVPGEKGDKGDQGERGLIGPKGDKGGVGPKGDTGDVGPQGERGPAGERGQDGVIGAKGDTGGVGPKGDKGEVGGVGPKGDKGDTGSAGPQGETGPKGDIGHQGEIGPKGEAGPKGDKGDTGELGPKGDKGDQGIQGEPGLSAGGVDISRKVICWARPQGSTSNVNVNNLSIAPTGTLTAGSITTVNLHRFSRRINYVSATSGVAGLRSTISQWCIGTGGKIGGFKYIARFGPSVGAAANETRRCFVGLSSYAAAATDSDPSTLFPNALGVCCDSADSNYHIIHRSSANAAVKVNTGIGKQAQDNTEVYELVMECAPGGPVKFTFTDVTTDQSFTYTATNDLPGSSTLMNPHLFYMSGGAESAIGFALMNLYLETDF